MLALIICIALMFGCGIMIIASIKEYASTRDNAYIIFCTLFCACMLFVLFGFLHFKPWLTL